MTRTLFDATARAPLGTLLIGLGMLGLLACDTPETEPVAALEAVPSPAAPGSGEPNLAVGPDGVVHLSWLEPSETGHALRFAAWAADGWGEPRTIIDRADLFVNWADFPSLAFFGDGMMAAHWLEKSGPGIYSYDVRMAFSRDGGATWSGDIVPHRDGIDAEHGFVSLVPLDSRLAALWLDGRATVDGEPMTLRFTTLDSTGELGPGVRVDATVCDCCQTAMAPTRTGLVAAYRDRTADEVRDIYVTRYVDGRWTDGQPVHEDGWTIEACPVNGPSLATAGDTVALAWFTAARPDSGSTDSAEQRPSGESARSYVAFSEDGGATFGPPIRVDDGQAMGRVDIAMLEDGRVLVSWLERTEAGAEVRVRHVDRSGPGPAMTIAGAAAERATGFPRMIRVGSRVVFAWTEPGESGGVRMAVGRLADS